VYARAGDHRLTVESSFAEAVLLETLTLSVLNHDSAVASAAARMARAAGDRPCIEMGSRRTHEEAAVAAARAAYLAGFASTSNLAAGRRHGVPTTGTAAHSWTLLHEKEADSFRAQVAALGPGTTLLVDTYDIAEGIRTAVEAAGPELGAVRIDSGDLAVLAHQAREQLDVLGAHRTRIVLSGDLDEFSLAALATAPVDAYGVGTSVVTGSGAPTAGFVYKLVEVEGRAVAKRSEDKSTRGGRKTAVRRHRPTGTATAEVVHAQGTPEARDGDRPLQVPYVRAGRPVDVPSLSASREHLQHVLTTLPWEGLSLSRGEPAIPTTHEGAP
jgi:nicotinate phosphoribosyltransferase